MPIAKSLDGVRIWVLLYVKLSLIANAADKTRQMPDSIINRINIAFAPLLFYVLIISFEDKIVNKKRKISRGIFKKASHTRGCRKSNSYHCLPDL
jgi:hypothetical protein